MVTNKGKNGGVPESRGVNWILIAVIMIIVCSTISWVMISKLAVPKSGYDSEITNISNSLGHIKDLATGLNNFANKQNNKIEDLTTSTQNALDGTRNKIDNLATSTQNSLDNTNNKISKISTQTDQIQSDLGGVKTEVGSIKIDTATAKNEIGTFKSDQDKLKSQVSTFKTDQDTLKSDVSSLKADRDTLQSDVNTLKTNTAYTGGIQINTAITSTSLDWDTGLINLSLTNNGEQQTVAFRVEFCPPSDSTVLPTNTSLEELLKTLYGAPPIKLYEGTTTTSSSEVKGDYVIFWNGSKFQVRTIVFITNGTLVSDISAGTQTRTLSFAYNPTAVSYDILITPETESTYSTTGAGVNTW